MEFFTLESEFLANGDIPIQKLKSKREGSGLTIYFVDIESQVINGYFCYGIDHPEATGLETLLWHLDSSGGLLPKSLRGEVVKPAWQFHGAENPLSDRDQSCYICTALGEKAFIGSFGCALFMIENMEAIINAHCADEEKKPDTEGSSMPSPALEDGLGQGDADSELETEPKILPEEVYCLSEAGEGAMAWEGTLQLMFPKIRCFWNRLLNQGEGVCLNAKIKDCYASFYRPDNLSVIVTGKMEDKEAILLSLVEYEQEYIGTHPLQQQSKEPYTRPWTNPLPEECYIEENATSVARFISRNPNREPTATVCLGWRGCNSKDIETAMALKVLTAHLAVGNLWNHFVTNGIVQRISWCQLEYLDFCSLITFHGIMNDEAANRIRKETDEILAELADEGKSQLKLEEIQAMADRVGWHYVREVESDPFLMIASSIAKGDRYGGGEREQLEKRLNPLPGYQELKNKSIDYWRGLIQKYFINGTYCTKVLPSSYEKPSLQIPIEAPVQPEVGDAQPFTSSSRRASSRPRRRANAVGEESSMAALSEKPAVPPQEVKRGVIEEMLKEKAFPFSECAEELQDFKMRLEQCGEFIKSIAEPDPYFFPIQTYRSDEPGQHPLFPVDKMPIFTFLEDIKTSFVYATLVLDTTHLDSKLRKMIAPIAAAMGAVLCPRPPGLDTDNEIKNPNEFNPPKHVCDSQVSLGVNGEMMQSLFMMMIVLPKNYDWVAGMFQNVLYEFEYSFNFIKFVCMEATKGLAANYRTQTAEVPNYDCFDATEINLHSLVNMAYKPESNARLFVGRRRLDAMNEFLAELDKDPEGTVKLVGEAWRKIVDEGRISLQIAGNIQELSADGKKDLVAPWKKYFEKVQNPLKFENIRPRNEAELMQPLPGDEGLAVTVGYQRSPCFTTAIPIDPSSADFPKLCIAAQLFSMAQKWIWACFGEPDCPMPVLRMPCSYSHMLTLNLESTDIIGSLEVMKTIMAETWEWIDPLLIATKNMVINDPAVMDQGAQGTIIVSLLSHLCGISPDLRRRLLVDSLKVSKEDIQEVIQNYLQHLLDPKQCWYALMTHASDQEILLNRLKDYGFVFSKRNLNEVCAQL